MRGSRYFLLFNDDYSHYRTIHLIAAKSNVVSSVEDFSEREAKHCPKGTEILRPNNGLEFVHRAIRKLSGNLRIQYQRTVIYPAEQNGSAEKKNRTVTVDRGGQHSELCTEQHWHRFNKGIKYHMSYIITAYMHICQR